QLSQFSNLNHRANSLAVMDAPSTRPCETSSSAFMIAPPAAPRIVLWASAINFTSKTGHLRSRPMVVVMPPRVTIPAWLRAIIFFEVGDHRVRRAWQIAGDSLALVAGPGRFDVVNRRLLRKIHGDTDKVSIEHGDAVALGAKGRVQPGDAVALQAAE